MLKEVPSNVLHGNYTTISTLKCNDKIHKTNSQHLVLKLCSTLIIPMYLFVELTTDKQYRTKIFKSDTFQTLIFFRIFFRTKFIPTLSLLK